MSLCQRHALSANISPYKRSCTCSFPCNLRLSCIGTKPTSDGGSKTAGEPLPEYTLALDNGAKAVVRTYGGNCFSYITKDGIEVMGTRGDAVRDDSKPYAGGNPHCFPQFGPGELAQHGFARGMKFVPGERAKEGSFERMVFKLVPTEETIKVWDHKFEYRCDITLREDCMEWDINVMNLGEEPFDITLGMHTYFDISSLKNVKIVGPFTGKSTLDRNKNEDGTAAGDEMTIAEATDMLIRDCSGPVSIIDSGKGTKTTIDSKGFADTCLWSPYGNDAMNFDKVRTPEYLSSKLCI